MHPIATVSLCHEGSNNLHLAVLQNVPTVPQLASLTFLHPHGLTYGGWGRMKQQQSTSDVKQHRPMVVDHALLQLSLFHEN